MKSLKIVRQNFHQTKSIFTKLKFLFLITFAFMLTAQNVQAQCATNVILLIDESASVSGPEIQQVKNGLTDFIDAQIGTGRTVSFIGMAPSDNGTRTDHVLEVLFPTDGTDVTAAFDTWIAGYRNGRTSIHSDFWASALAVADDIAASSLDVVIVVADGAQTSNINTPRLRAETIENTGAQLFAVGIDFGSYFNSSGQLTNNANIDSTVVGLWDNVAGSSGNPIQEVANDYSNFTTAEYDRVVSFADLSTILSDIPNFLQSPRPELSGTSTGTPPVRTLSNSCPSEVADLNSLIISTTPTGFEVRWSTDNDTSDGLSMLGNAEDGNGDGIVDDPTTVEVEDTYYGYYYNTASGCYSNPPTDGVVVTITPCCAAGTEAPSFN